MAVTLGKQQQNEESHLDIHQNGRGEELLAEAAAGGDREGPRRHEASGKFFGSLMEALDCFLPIGGLCWQDEYLRE